MSTLSPKSLPSPVSPAAIENGHPDQPAIKKGKIRTQFPAMSVATKRQQLNPLNQVNLTADRLRQMARELMMQADALDALGEQPKEAKRKNVQLIDPRKEESDAKL